MRTARSAVPTVSRFELGFQLIPNDEILLVSCLAVLSLSIYVQLADFLMSKLRPQGRVRACASRASQKGTQMALQRELPPQAHSHFAHLPPNPSSLERFTSERRVSTLPGIPKRCVRGLMGFAVWPRSRSVGHPPPAGTDLYALRSARSSHEIPRCVRMF